MEEIIKKAPYITVVVDFPRREDHLSRTEYLRDRAARFQELCEIQDSVAISGYFYHSDIVKLYELLGYELPEHLVDMKDIPTKNGRFFYTIMFNPKMNGDSAK